MPDSLKRAYARQVRSSNEVDELEQLAEFLRKEDELTSQHAIFGIDPTSSKSTKITGRENHKIFDARSNSRRLRPTQATVAHTAIEHNNPESLSGPHCWLCQKNNHELNECRNFERMNVKARDKFIWKKRLCFNYLKLAHDSRSCWVGLQYTTCGGNHHSLLHRSKGLTKNMGSSTIKSVNQRFSNE